jgi:serine/threonine protein kinase
MILAGGHAGPEERIRFLAESEAVAAVKHPGIVQIHDFGTHDGLPFFSLEFCEGGSLADRLADTPLPPPEAARLVRRIAQAVQAAHERGIIHRDLKPGNILIGEDGTPKNTDFGPAKRVEAAGLTGTCVVMGTPSYMPAEQAQGKPVGPAADVYALGAILYECLTGRPPFRAASALDTLLQVVRDEPVPPRQLNARVPADLETVCLKCLQKVSGRRYPSAADMGDDLERYLSGEPIKARPAGPLERALKWARRRPAQATLIAGLVLGLAGLMVGGSLFAWQAEQSRRSAEEHALKETRLRQTADENLELAKKAVDDCFNVARTDPLFQQPRMEKAKKLLLAKTLGFYKNIQETSPAPHFAILPCGSFSTPGPNHVYADRPVSLTRPVSITWPMSPSRPADSTAGLTGLSCPDTRSRTWLFPGQRADGTMTPRSASPKSVTSGLPASPGRAKCNRMLAGLMSRCTTPMSWA